MVPHCTGVLRILLSLAFKALPRLAPANSCSLKQIFPNSKILANLLDTPCVPHPHAWHMLLPLLEIPFFNPAFLAWKTPAYLSKTSANATSSTKLSDNIHSSTSSHQALGLSHERGLSPSSLESPESRGCPFSLHRPGMLLCSSPVLPTF